LLAVEYLKLLKRRFTYDELSKRLSLPAPVLNRYIRGYVLPRDERAKQIIEFAEQHINLEKELLSRIQFDERGYFDNTKIIYDVVLLKLIINKKILKFAKWKINKVMTAAVDGLPLATLVASELGVNLVFAKREKEVGVKSFLEEVYVPRDSGITVSLYIPRNSIRPREKVLIVDDVIRTGETQRALINLVSKAKGAVAGIFVLIAIGDAWRRRIPKNIPVDYFVKIEPPR